MCKSVHAAQDKTQYCGTRVGVGSEVLACVLYQPDYSGVMVMCRVYVSNVSHWPCTQVLAIITGSSQLHAKESTYRYVPIK